MVVSGGWWPNEVMKILIHFICLSMLGVGKVQMGVLLYICISNEVRRTLR